MTISKIILSLSMVFIIVACGKDNPKYMNEPTDLTKSKDKESASNNDGTVGGGGGKVVACRNTSGDLTSVELLDLFEAKNIYGLSINESSASVADQVASTLTALDGLDPNMVAFGYGLASELRRQILIIDQNTNWVKNAHLQLTTDSYEKIVPPSGCQIEQLINYTALGEVMFDKELWDKMSITNQAAAKVHEALYAFLREEYSETNSLRTRKAVGLAISGHQFKPFALQLPKKRFSCTGVNPGASDKKAQTRLVVYEENNQVKLAVTQSVGRVILGLDKGIAIDGFSTLDSFYTAHSSWQGQMFVFEPEIRFQKMSPFYHVSPGLSGDDLNVVEDYCTGSMCYITNLSCARSE